MESIIFVLDAAACLLREKLKVLNLMIGLITPIVSSVAGRRDPLGGGILRPPTSGGSTELALLRHAFLHSMEVQFNSTQGVFVSDR